MKSPSLRGVVSSTGIPGYLFLHPPPSSEICSVLFSIGFHPSFHSFIHSYLFFALSSSFPSFLSLTINTYYLLHLRTLVIQNIFGHPIQYIPVAVILIRNRRITSLLAVCRHIVGSRLATFPCHRGPPASLRTLGGHSIGSSLPLPPPPCWRFFPPVYFSNLQFTHNPLLIIYPGRGGQRPTWLPVAR